MSYKTKYIFTASMDVDPEKEDLFNEVYDTEHIPALLQVEGCISVTRLLNHPTVNMSISGEIIQKESNLPKYSAIYEITSPEVVTSDAWAAAVEHGRWAPLVRPYTFNRTHCMQEVVVTSTP